MTALREADDAVVELRLPAAASSIMLARSRVHALFDDLDDDVLGDVELIAGELVSNAVKHGEPEIVLRLRRDSFAIDVAVLDHGMGTPSMQVAKHDDAPGRGLTIVDRLALRWGYDFLSDETGKVVWASIGRA